MSDPNRNLESANVDAPPTPAPAANSPTTPAAAGTIAANDPNYPPYLLTVCDFNGAVVASIDGPHTSARIRLAAATSEARVRVVHVDTASGPNLQVFVEGV